MTRIDTLAELLTRPETDLVLVGEVGRDFTPAERETLAAALRLAEHVAFTSGPVDMSLFANYRSARQHLTGIAP